VQNSDANKHKIIYSGCEVVLHGRHGDTPQKKLSAAASGTLGALVTNVL